MTDRAFEDLERRCRKLNQKLFFKWFFGFMLLVGLIAMGCFAFYYYNPLKKKIVAKKIVVKQKKLTKILPKVKKNDNYNTIVLKPTIIVPKREISKKVLKKVLKKVEKKSTVEKKPQKVISPTVNIRVTSIKSEQSLLKDDKNNENFDTTLTLARYYYNNDKYEKTIYYAKKANHYKPSSFKPWEYYSKAKMKQNKKSEAIEAIKQYLSYFNSEDAIRMLQKMESKK
ncbi:MAG: hypothetical protein GXP61_10165 [Epsilonproteobacteria bacterium]|nr:hypothetical protein [Campylobacterota bacterium]